MWSNSLHLYLQASIFEQVPLETWPAAAPNHSLRSHHQLKRCNSQMQLASVAAAVDTSLTQFGSAVDKRQAERESIKKAKHNRGTSALYIYSRNISLQQFYGLCCLSSMSSFARSSVIISCSPWCN